MLERRNHDTSPYAHVRFNRRDPPSWEKTRGVGGVSPATPRLTPSRRGRRMPGRRYRWGRAACAPVPLVRTTGGGDGCRRHAPFGSGSAEPYRDELRALARLHADQHGALAVLLRIADRDCGYRRVEQPCVPPTSRMTSPALKPCSAAMPSGSTCGDDHAVAAAAGDLAGRAQRQAEPRQRRARSARGSSGVARPRARSAARRASP